MTTHEMMILQLQSPEYDFISDAEKDFVIAFDKAIQAIGYESGGIVPYVCFGKYKIEYTKAGNKTKKFVARFYFRESGIVLRLYFNNIDKHSTYIENAPDFIKAPFINDVGKCKHCYQNGGGIGKDGKCSFKKSYTLDNTLYEKCSGENYYFDNHDLSAIPFYMALIERFYRQKRGV